MALADKLLKNKNFKSFVKTNIEEEPKEFYHAGSITLNLLLSGKVDGGTPEKKVTMLAAPRAHFKSIIATISSANAQRKGATVVWVDSEFAFDNRTANMFGLETNTDKFVLIQDNSLEELIKLTLSLFNYNNTKQKEK